MTPPNDPYAAHHQQRRSPRPPTRVLYVDHTAVMGGGEIALLNLCRHLDRTRVEPIVLLCSDGPLAAALRSHDVETHVVPLAPDIVHTRKGKLGLRTLLRVADFGRLIRYVFILAQFIRDHRIDLVHTNSLKADIIGGLAARLARTPVLWHVRDRIADDYLPSGVVRLFRALAYTLPNYVIAVSTATMKTLLPHYAGLAGSDPRTPASDPRHPWFFVVHDGTDVGPLPPQAPPIPGRPPSIGLVGRISPHKGQHVFVRAAAQVLRRHPDARFQVIGAALFAEDDYEARLRQYVAEHGLGHAVEFTGFRADVGRAIADLDVLVHASTVGEPFGQVLIEGMAAGKPVVATRGGGVPEIVEDGVCGFLVPMGNAAALAESISRLLDDPSMASQMGHRGRRRVADHFDIRHTAAKVEQVSSAVRF